MKFAFYAKLAMTGAIILGLELVASRILTPFFGVSLNVWSSILAVTLVALAAGYKFGGYLSNRLKFSSLVSYFIGGGVISAAWLNLSFYSYPRLLSSLSDWGLVIGSITACLYIIFIPLFVFSSLNTVLITILSNSIYSNSQNKDYNSGSVFFISTVGSVVGIFIVTYFLLAHFSNHSVYIFLSLISALLTILLALFCSEVNKIQKKYLLISSFFMLLVASGFAIDNFRSLKVSTFINEKTGANWMVIDKIPSFYGNHAVVDFDNGKGFEWRGLLTSGVIQNMIFKSGVSAGLSNHALEILSLSGKMVPEKALVLGLGVGVIPRRLSEQGLNVDVVELDPKVLNIAQTYFSFDKSPVNLFFGDARTFVRDCPDKYDVVIIDLFHGDGIPPHVVSFEFFSDIKKCLTNFGALVMNAFYGGIIRESQKSLFKTLVTVFGPIVVFEKPGKKEKNVQQGFIIARNTLAKWSIKLTISSHSKFMSKRLSPIFKNWKKFNRDSQFLKGVLPNFDRRNDWRRQTIYVNIAYRNHLKSFVPWQILLD